MLKSQTVLVNIRFSSLLLFDDGESKITLIKVIVLFFMNTIHLRKSIDLIDAKLVRMAVNKFLIYMYTP